MIKNIDPLKRAAFFSTLLHLGVFALAFLTISPEITPLINLEQTITADLVSEKDLKPAKRQKKASKKPKQATYAKPAPKKEINKNAVVLPKKEKAVPAPTKPKKKEKVHIQKLETKKAPIQKQEDSQKKGDIKTKDQKPSFLKSVKNLEQQQTIQKEEEKKASWSEKLGEAIFTYQEMAALRTQMAQCWNIPVGAKNAEELLVEMTLEVNPDATVKSVKIVDQARMANDSFFRTAAESALRAIYNPLCSPLHLPLNKYEKWKTLTLVFNPRNILGF